jgi:hypothetical protein
MVQNAAKLQHFGCVPAKGLIEQHPYFLCYTGIHAPEMRHDRRGGGRSLFPAQHTENTTVMPNMKCHKAAFKGIGG